MRRIRPASESRTARSGDGREDPGSHSGRMNKLTLITVVAIATAVAGCGSSDKPLTKSQVIARGTVICKNAEKRVEALPQLAVEHPFAKGNSAKTQNDARTFLAGYADALELSHSGLAKLDAPSEDKELLDGYLGDLSRIAAQFR